MKTAIVFAASIFESTKLNVIREFFSVFKEYFSDADFYVTLNYGSLEEQKTIIKSYVDNVTFWRLEDERLYTKTEASAFQHALKNLKNVDKTYDVYWFVHSKGGHNSRDEIRQMYFNEMFSQRKPIEELFEKYPKLGSWAIRGNARNSLGVWWKDYNVDCTFPICINTKVDPFNYTHVNYSYIEGLYVLKGKPVEDFVKSLPESFFQTKLDPWYFETVLSWVPSRCGYYPYVKRRECFWNQGDLLDITAEWIKENKLTELEPYLNI